MPIYAYRCAACGHAKDVLQKMSDPVLQDCPACGAPSFVKQVTAAGFQLKGSGWYVTDFKGENKANASAPADGAAAPDAAKADVAKDGTAAAAAPAAAPKSDTATTAPAPAPAPAAPAAGAK